MDGIGTDGFNNFLILTLVFGLIGLSVVYFVIEGAKALYRKITGKK